jgi:hypothetical protein
MLTLKGIDVYGKIVLDGTERKDKNDLPYYVARVGKKGFTIRADVFADLKAGVVREINLEESNYEREDPATGTVTTVESLVYAGHLTNVQEFNVTKHEVSIKAMLNEVLSPKAMANMSAAQAAEVDALVG